MSARTATLLLCLLLCSGCWVIEEIDSGSQYMDAHSERGAAKAAGKSPEKQEAGDGSSFDLAGQGKEALATVAGWWDDLGKPGPDPEDGIVRCRTGRGLEYTHRSSCLAAGGVPQSN